VNRESGTVINIRVVYVSPPDGDEAAPEFEPEQKKKETQS
jgi:hypothetical protein